MHTHRLRWLVPLLAATGTTMVALLTASGHAHPAALAQPTHAAIDFTGDPRPTIHPLPAPTTTPARRTRHTVPHASAAPTRVRVRTEHTAAPAAGRSRPRPRLVITGSGLRGYAQALLGDAFDCFDSIVRHESGWSVTATNPSSGAYGLMQALPGSKMAAYGSDWRTNGRTQIRWGIHYINAHYGGACSAWAFWQSHGWY